MHNQGDNFETYNNNEPFIAQTDTFSNYFLASSLVNKNVQTKSKTLDLEPESQDLVG